MKIWQFILLILIITSCEDLLDLQPTNSINGERAIQDEADLQNAIRGCYDALQSDGYYGRLFLVIGEIGSDNAYNGGTILDYEQFNRNNVNPDNRFLEEIWSSPYVAINRCNTAIYYTNKLALSEENRTIYLAELYFLRALNYYNLVRLFKNVPLKLEPTFDDKNFNISLSGEEDIYDQILKDLKFANNKLINSNPNFASDLAVKTLFAKTYLELERYEDAIMYANFVLTSDKDLMENYNELFTDENNKESIFELSFTESLNDKNRLAEYCLPNSLGGRYEIAPEIDLINAFESGDTRKQLFTGVIPYCNKYESLTSGADNVYIFRLAELYLLRAEARTQLQENTTLIMNDINKIRERAGLSTIYSESYSELMKIIQAERRYEFAFEGHRRFDLVRTGQANQVLNIENENYYYPIPFTELNTNDAIN